MFARFIASCGVLMGGFVLLLSGQEKVDPVILLNRHSEVGIDPGHGLILGFGRPGGVNLLWINPHPLSSARHPGWINYGGEKLWWGPYRDWPAVLGRIFPPDEAFDRPWNVIASDQEHVVMQSAVSDRVGIRAQREIRLARDRAGIFIQNRFTRERENSQPLQLWTVCQLPPPRWCWLDSQPGMNEAAFVNLRPQIDAGAFLQVDAVAGLVRCAPTDEGFYMIGTRGAWIAAVYDDLIIVHQVEPYPDGDYSEQVSLQVFCTTNYVELETLSGLANPAVGQTMSNTVHWRLLDRPKGLTEGELGQWLRAQLASPD